MDKKPKVLATWIMCPDGTMLPSFHRHDYREHTTIDLAVREHPDGVEEPEDFLSDEYKKWLKESEVIIKESRFSMVDGGDNDYSRRGGVFTEMSIYSDDPFKVIRRFLCRGGRGSDGREHITWTPLFRMSDKWLFSLLTYLMRNIGNLKTISHDAHISSFSKDNLTLRKVTLEFMIGEIKLGVKGEDVPNYGKYMPYYLEEAKYRIENNIFIKE